MRPLAVALTPRGVAAWGRSSNLGAPPMSVPPASPPPPAPRRPPTGADLRGTERWTFADVLLHRTTQGKYIQEKIGIDPDERSRGESVRPDPTVYPDIQSAPIPFELLGYRQGR